MCPRAAALSRSAAQGLGRLALRLAAGVVTPGALRCDGGDCRARQHGARQPAAARAPREGRGGPGCAAPGGGSLAEAEVAAGARALAQSRSAGAAIEGAEGAGAPRVTAVAVLFPVEAIVQRRAAGLVGEMW